MPDPHWQRREAMIGRQSWPAPLPLNTWELRGFWTEPAGTPKPPTWRVTTDSGDEPPAPVPRTGPVP